MERRSASGSRSAMIALVLGLAMPSAVFALADERSALTSAAPAIELPTLPVATPTLPPLPVATPTLPPLPVATPTPPLQSALPSLLPPSGSVLGPPPSDVPVPSIGPSSTSTASTPALAAGFGQAQPSPPTSLTWAPVPESESPFSGLVLPGLLVGTSALLLLLIVGIQLVGGAAWMPVIRRWVNGGVVPPGGSK